MYIFLLMLLDLAQTIGSGLLNYGGFVSGLCIVDVTSCLYFTLFTPLVYHTFLSEFFRLVLLRRPFASGLNLNFITSPSKDV